jgi:hypothetical protein
MQKAFLKDLLQKPSPYLQVWVFLYCNMDENNEFHIASPFLLSKFGLTRSTLQRILDFGCEWQGSGKVVARKWNGNELTISWLDNMGGKEVAREWQESGKKKDAEMVDNAEVNPKKRKKSESSKLFPQMVEEYNQFCIKKCGAGAKMNALQGKAMKGIIEYLAKQVQSKHGNELTQDSLEENIFVAWQYILNNWNNVKGYYAEQIKLNQIDSNLPNILMQLKNNQKNKRDEKFADNYEQLGNISFD